MLNIKSFDFKNTLELIFNKFTYLLLFDGIFKMVIKFYKVNNFIIALGRKRKTIKCNYNSIN